MSNPHSVAAFIKQYYPQYWNKICSYPADECACIRKTKEEWGILGNFGMAPLNVNGVLFKNAELLFQMMKFQDKAILKELHANAGMGLKMKAKHYETEHRRPDWGSFFVDALKFCLMTKYEQCAEFRAELERSKGLYIVEDQINFSKKNPDAWGVKLVDGMYVGPSLLGQLLMELRDNGKLEYTLPSDALAFTELLKD